MLAVPLPVIILLLALLLIVVEVTVAKVLSPLKNVVASFVPEAPILAIGTVPLAKSEASRLVRLAPDIAGNVAGNLASGIVPSLRLLALSSETVKDLNANTVNKSPVVAPLPSTIDVPDVAV